MPRSVREAFDKKGVSLEVLVREDYEKKAYIGPMFRFIPSPRREGRVFLEDSYGRDQIERGVIWPRYSLHQSVSPTLDRSVLGHL